MGWRFVSRGASTGRSDSSVVASPVKEAVTSFALWQLLLAMRGEVFAENIKYHGPTLVGLA